MTPESPTATKVPLPKVTPFNETVVPEFLDVHISPSGEGEIDSLFPPLPQLAIRKERQIIRAVVGNNCEFRFGDTCLPRTHYIKLYQAERLYLNTNEC